MASSTQLRASRDLDILVEHRPLCGLKLPSPPPSPSHLPSVRLKRKLHWKLRPASAAVFKGQKMMAIFETSESVTAFDEVLKKGNLDEALNVMEGLVEQGVDIPTNELVLLVQRCIKDPNLAAGKRLFFLSFKHRLASDPLLRKQLVSMLCFLGGLLEADEVFDGLWKEDVFWWSVIICAHAKLGQTEKAIELYHAMRTSDIEPNHEIFVAVLETCSTLKSLEDGVLLHVHAAETGQDMDALIISTIIDMYCESGSILDARRVFNKFWPKSMESLYTIMEGYCHIEDLPEALNLLRSMQQEGLNPSSSLLMGLIKMCTKSTALELIRQLHASVIEGGVESDLNICNALIDMYAKGSAFDDARVLLDRMHVRDVVSWNAVITGYSRHGCLEEAFQVLQAMQQQKSWPDDVTFICLLTACCKLEHLDRGKQLHASVLNLGLDANVWVGNSLLNMYVKCGSLQDAQAVFNALPEKDMVSWNVIIRGCLEHEHDEGALAALKDMQAAGIQPNFITFLPILKVCSNMSALEEGKQIHSIIIQRGLDMESSISNSLIDMYTKCGSLHDARFVFNKSPKSSVVTWNIMIAGYALHEHGQEALQLFSQLEQERVEPDKVTYLSAIRACASIAALGWGKRIHDAVKQAGFTSDLFVTNALVDMYAKCGSLKDAHQAFDALEKRDVVTWTGLISGYAEQNDYVVASQLFQDMQQEGIKPDELAYLSLLAACSHQGLVERGLFHLKEMRDNHGIVEILQHYDCVVDLVGCKGLLDVAEDLLETIPFEANLAGWLSLLGSCRLHNNVEIARRCFDTVVSVSKECSAAYVLMSSTYAKAGMHREAKELEISRRGEGAWKKTGKSFIEVENHVHYFTAEDKTHPQYADIHAKLESLSWQAKAQGLVNHSSLSPVPLSLIAEQDLFCRHSEKLAVAFGLLNVPSDTKIRVAKNIRVCSACHEAIKIISKIERRELIVKDVDCIHYFKDGACSCKDRYYVVNNARDQQALAKD